MRILPATILLALGLPAAALAANGLNLIGFGVESVAMGGADTAVARDTTALNTNPAGLAQQAGAAFDVYGAGAYALDIGHSDALGNDRGIANRLAPIGGFGAKLPATSSGLSFGIGAFAQGGSGVVYKDLRTPFGTHDELSAQIGFLRVTPGVAWRVDDSLQLGIALPVTAIVAKQKVFPATSVSDTAAPERSFYGFRLAHARGVRTGVRLGALWKPLDRWTFGVEYASRTSIDATHGSADVNLTAAGLGIVHYRDAQIRGFAIAREVAVGTAWQVAPHTLLAAKIEQLKWSQALRSLGVTLGDPDNPAAPASISQTSRIGWRDQYVLALGVAQQLTPQFTGYAGFNHGRNPGPPETLTPLLAAIAENHTTGGIAYRFEDG